MIGKNNQVNININAINKTFAGIAAAERDLNKFAAKKQAQLDSIAKTSKSKGLATDTAIELNAIKAKNRIATTNIRSEGNIRLAGVKAEGKVKIENAKIESRIQVEGAKAVEKTRREGLKTQRESLKNEIVNERLLRIRQRPTYQQSQLARQQRISTENRNQFITRAAIAAGAGTAAAGYFALGNYKEMEQMRIRMGLQFGEEGLKILEDLKKFAAATAFNLNDTVLLLEGIKLGADNLGIKTSQDMLKFMKTISLPILAYSPNAEARDEIVNQLRQIFASGKANERQDLRVIMRRGFPIQQMIVDYASKINNKKMNFGDVRDKYGKELPAWLVAAAIADSGNSKAVINAMIGRAESFTQASDAFSESLKFASASLGEVSDKALLMTPKLNSLSKFLLNLDSTLTDIDPKTGKRTPNPMASGAVKLLAAGVGALGIGALAIALKSPRFGGVLKEAVKSGFGIRNSWSTPMMQGPLLPNIARPSMKVSRTPSLMQGYAAGYNIAFSDYGNVVTDIVNKPMEGLIKNADTLLLTVLAMTNPLTAIAATAKILYDLTQDKPTKYSGVNEIGDRFLNAIYSRRAASLKEAGDFKGAEKYTNMIIDIDKTKSNYSLLEKQNTPNIEVYNDFNITGDAKVESSKTKAGFKYGGATLYTVMSKDKTLNF